MDAETTRLLGFSVGTWIVNIVGFLVLLWMLRKWLWGPLRSAVEGRAERIANQLKQAEEKLAEAERLREEARQYRDAQEAEMARQRQALLSEAQAEADRITQQAREEAKEIRRQGRKAAAELEAEALERAKAEAARLAGGMAEKLLAGVLDEERQRAILDAALEDLERLVDKEGGW